jgi:hypothetical protein
MLHDLYPLASVAHIESPSRYISTGLNTATAVTACESNRSIAKPHSANVGEPGRRKLRQRCNEAWRKHDSLNDMVGQFRRHRLMR